MNLAHIHIFPKSFDKELTAFTTTRRSGIISIPDLRYHLETHYPWITGIHYLQQIHSSSFIEVHNQGRGLSCYPDRDALFTFDAGQALIIQTADCVPIFIYHPASGLVGLVHAGWRGIYQGILTSLFKTLKYTYKINLEEIYVASGPFIQPCCFEVGEDIINIFVDRYKEAAHVVNDRYLDLGHIIKYQCRKFNIPVTHFFHTSECTQCKEDLYFSYRREGKYCQRLYSVVARQPSSDNNINIV